MRVDRIVKQYKTVLDNQENEKVYNTILNDYSVADISVADFAVLLESNWRVKYTPEKIGNSQLQHKEENSRILREKIAKLAANIICTDQHELKQYNYLNLLLDFSGTEESVKKNKEVSDTLVHGSKAEKTKVFWDRINPLLELKKSVLDAKTDEELAQNWDKWAPSLKQFEVLDKIIEEAVSIGVEINPMVEQRMKNIQHQSQMSVSMLNCRAGMVASVYYSKINEGDINKIKESVLTEIMQRSPMTLKDYLSDNIEIIKYTDEHIRKQLLDKVQQIGYKKPEDAVLGNIRGRAYEYEDAIEVLKSNRPVYVIGENRKLIGVIESSGRDGFLKPISIRKQNTLIKDYMEKSKHAVQKMVSENKPLSQEGQKAARYYMAKVVCYERLLNDKKMGNGSLSQVIGDDEKKFQKAATMIYNDPVFEKLTDKISLEQLEDFMNNHGEKELNRQYIRESMVLKQDQPEVPSIQI